MQKRRLSARMCQDRGAEAARSICEALLVTSQTKRMKGGTQDRIISVSTLAWPARTAVVALIALGIAFGWLAVRWQIGNLLASLTSAEEPGAAKIADSAVSFSPRDPAARWLRAVIERDVPTKESRDSAIGGMRETIRLSPNNFHWWLELGRTLERFEMPDQAEMAFKRALVLAPSYTLPRWQMGNFLLRQGRTTEAFRELRKAAESDPVYREQVFSIVWDYYDRDVNRLEEIVGDAPEVRLGLAKYYAGHDLPERSMLKWNSLSDKEKEANKQVGRLIARALFEKRFLNAALRMANQVGIENGAAAAAVQNPGFEISLATREVGFFGWKIEPADELRIQVTGGKQRSGSKSLRLAFNGFDKPELSNVYQTLALKRETNYELSFWIRTEQLRSAGTPMIEILNAKTNKIIAGSGAFPSGSNDWSRIRMKFTSPGDVDGVVVRTARSFCGENCPITGTVFYDDFRLVELRDPEGDD